MEIRISAAELTKALTMLHGVVQKKNTMPILSNILLEARAGMLVLSATDLDIGMRITKNCEVLREGATTVAARAFFDIVKVLPGPDVSLSHMPSQHLSIRSGRTNAKLVALAAEDFPQLPSLEGLSFCTIPTAAFVEMVQKTIYSTSVDENRYNLTGVLLEPQGTPGKFAFISTDGHRLSRIERSFNANPCLTLAKPVILPRKGLYELIRLLEVDAVKESDGFELAFSPTQVIVRQNQTVLTMRLIDGEFPDYERVIPRIADKILRASRMDVLTGLKRVSVLAHERTQSVKFATLNGELVLSCMNPETGEVLDHVPVDYSGADIEMRFNARYMIEALSSISETNVMFKLTDSLSPMLVTGMTDDSHLCVVMPMRM